MGIGGVGLGVQMRLKGCDQVLQRMDAPPNKGSMTGGAGEKRKFPFGF